MPDRVVDDGSPTGAVNPKYRYFVKAGTRGMDQWVVIDRKDGSIGICGMHGSFVGRACPKCVTQPKGLS